MMIEYEIDRIRDILTDVLGAPKNEPYSSGWQSFNCPYCASMEGIDSDGKFNMETNIEHGCVFHCWKCETKGKLSRLLRDFGNEAQINEYKSILNSIRNSRLYQLGNIDGALEMIDVETYISLPNEYIKLTPKMTENAALKYLRKRGITDEIIDRYNIGYTSYCKDYFYKNRVIIPSYDETGELNYWVGRDYTGMNKVKYCNPKIQKTSIVFNEGLVNWYEDITLVEGPFDHIVVPNSIPLLGKSLTRENAVYKALLLKAKANINILLDDDAYDNAFKMYKFLNGRDFKDRVRLIKCPDGYDASLIFENYGKKGILRLLSSAIKVSEYDLNRY